MVDFFFSFIHCMNVHVETNFAFNLNRMIQHPLIYVIRNLDNFCINKFVIRMRYEKKKKEMHTSLYELFVSFVRHGLHGFQSISLHDPIRSIDTIFNG